MIGRNGETFDSVRDLILVDEESLKSLLAFLEIEPKEFRWVMEAINFRDLVLEKFDQLTNDFGCLGTPSRVVRLRCRIEIASSYQLAISASQSRSSPICSTTASR
jgi:hypothetical protein